MQNKAIGIFDSGVGGLSCVKELLSLLENENIVYLGDIKRMPYGIKDKKTLTEYTINDVGFLNTKDVKIIAAACGTVSSNVEISDVKNLKTKYVNLINPTVKKAIGLTKNEKIAIIATASTVKSNVFQTKLLEKNPNLDIISIACPDFVTLIEKGHIDDEIIKQKAMEYLKEVKDFSADTLILGCTHFPIISKVISEILGNNVALVNSGAELAQEIKEVLKETNLLKDEKSNAKIEFFTTLNTEKFDEVSKIFLGEGKGGKATLVDIEN